MFSGLVSLPALLGPNPESKNLLLEVNPTLFFATTCLCNIKPLFPETKLSSSLSLVASACCGRFSGAMEKKCFRAPSSDSKPRGKNPHEQKYISVPGTIGGAERSEVARNGRRQVWQRRVRPS
ncbi:hypothetical protein IEQ34_018918 [Dendrobium chrysotoxum]|uniref:Uncharacterized protein n=1 Tax=Dendrobium chrysotoxum TaxID=161865 RepID=A0AAV7FPT8_DENCH|nr:hypothetical protein IEQ34_018918 [Dendrobium chrysotoxum]